MSSSIQVGHRRQQAARALPHHVVLGYRFEHILQAAQVGIPRQRLDLSHQAFQCSHGGTSGEVGGPAWKSEMGGGAGQACVLRQRRALRSSNCGETS